MSTSFEHIVNDLQAADSAKDELLRAAGEYQAACISGEWKRLDTIRLRASACLESFFDNLAAAYRVVERTDSGDGTRDR